MSELDQTIEKENKNVEAFAKNLKGDLEGFGEKDEKNSNNVQNNEDDPDFDLTVADVLDLIGDDNIKAFLNLPEKTAIKFALKTIPEKDRINFKINSKDDRHFADLKLRLSKKLIQKYGGNLNAKVSPELALLAIMIVSSTLAFVQTKGEVNRYLIDLKRIEENK